MCSPTTLREINLIQHKPEPSILTVLDAQRILWRITNAGLGQLRQVVNKNNLAKIQSPNGQKSML
jgi:hypothetical protein